jgi:glucose/arabinose dehydrogenase
MSTPNKDSNGGNTALYSGVLENNNLKNVKKLYQAIPFTKKGVHFGSRIVFDKSGLLYFSIGDRGQRDVFPQDISKDNGKIYRLNDDGSIPNDNPFFNVESAKKAIYSYGHRNPQGMILHPNGEIWIHEHGPRGGDEINVIESGKNFGWPTITYGKNYTGTKITNETKRKGMEQPIYYWIPSIAPSGMAYLNNSNYVGWN